MHLYLHEHFPKDGHVQKAHKVFEKSTAKQAISQGLFSEALIKKADAFRAMGDMHELVSCLKEGVDIAAEINSLRRLSEASDVMGRVPPEWQIEKAIQTLQKDISHALVVLARR